MLIARFFRVAAGQMHRLEKVIQCVHRYVIQGRLSFADLEFPFTEAHLLLDVVFFLCDALARGRVSEELLVELAQLSSLVVGS